MDADSLLDHVFFPDSGVVSVVAVYADGSIIEMATISREGCTGMQAFFGAKTSSMRLLVQIPGSAAKGSLRSWRRAARPQDRSARQRTMALNATWQSAKRSCPGTEILTTRHGLYSPKWSRPPTGEVHAAKSDHQICYAAHRSCLSRPCDPAHSQ
jgi:hypothetical protein